MGISNRVSRPVPLTAQLREEPPHLVRVEGAHLPDRVRRQQLTCPQRGRGPSAGQQGHPMGLAHPWIQGVTCSRSGGGAWAGAWADWATHGLLVEDYLAGRTTTLDRLRGLARVRAPKAQDSPLAQGCARVSHGRLPDSPSEKLAIAAAGRLASTEPRPRGRVQQSAAGCGAPRPRARRGALRVPQRTRAHGGRSPPPRWLV